MKNTEEYYRPILVEDVPCGWAEWGMTCGSGKPAVHVLLQDLPIAKADTPLCAYHSPFDV